MNHKMFELWQAITIADRLIEIWHKQSQPGAETWHLTDFEIKIDGKIFAAFPRRSVTAEVFRKWEKLAGLASCGYPILPHCPTGGTPHYRHIQTGAIYYAPYKGLWKPSLFIQVQGVSYEDIKNQPSVRC